MASNENYILSCLYFHVKKTSVSAVPFFQFYTSTRSRIDVEVLQAVDPRFRFPFLAP